MRLLIILKYKKMSQLSLRYGELMSYELHILNPFYDCEARSSAVSFQLQLFC